MSTSSLTVWDEEIIHGNEVKQKARWTGHANKTGGRRGQEEGTFAVIRLKLSDRSQAEEKKSRDGEGFLGTVIVGPSSTSFFFLLLILFSLVGRTLEIADSVFWHPTCPQVNRWHDGMPG